MATFTFLPKSSSVIVYWSDPTIWSGSIVPNASDATVLFTLVTYNGSTQPYVSDITIRSSETFMVGGLSLIDDDLVLNGTLTATQAFAIGNGGELDINGTLIAPSLQVGGFDIQGSGTSCSRTTTAPT